MLNAQLRAHTGRAADILVGTASGILLRHLCGNAKRVVALLDKQRGGDGAIDPTTHCNGHDALLGRRDWHVFYAGCGLHHFTKRMPSESMDISRSL